MDLLCLCDPLRMLQVGAGRRKCKEASEIHILSTWQQVLQRGNPFSVKGGLREQRQSKFCSKRHHGHVKKISPGSSGHSRPQRLHKYFSTSTNVSTITLFSLPPLFPPKSSQARTRTEGPPPPRPRPPPRTQSEPSQNPFKHGGRL